MAKASRDPALSEDGGALTQVATSSAGGGGTLGCRYPASAEGGSFFLSFLGTEGTRGGAALTFRGCVVDRPGGVSAHGNRDSDGGGITSEGQDITLAWWCVALTFRDSVSSGGGPSRRGGVSSKRSGNSRAFTTWPSAPLSCGPGPCSAAVTLPADSWRGPLLLRGFGPFLSDWAGLLGTGVGGPWGARVEAGGTWADAEGVGGMAPRDTQGPDCGAQKNPWGLGPQKMCGENPVRIGALSTWKVPWGAGQGTLPQRGRQVG